MSGDPELWNYRTGAEAPQPLWKQSWNIPPALAAASALTLALLASALSSRIQTRRQTDQSSLTFQKKKSFIISRKDLWKLNSCPGVHVAPQFESVLEITAELWSCHHVPYCKGGNWSGCSRKPVVSVCRLLCRPEQLITSSQPDLLCFTSLSPTQEAAVAIPQNPQRNVFSGLWGSRTPHKEGLSAGH